MIISHEIHETREKNIKESLIKNPFVGFADFVAINI